MSVVNDSLEGDKIYNIREWWLTSEIGGADNMPCCFERKIEIGEELTFIDAYLDEKNHSKPYAWQVKFMCKDGYVGHAAHFNFLTAEEWGELCKFFLFEQKNNDKSIKGIR